MTFEFDGEKYKKASDHQKEWGCKLITEFKFKGTESILDLGCGDGAITAKIAEQLPNGHVVGIDSSKGMIETAINNHKSKNLEFKLMDINSIDYRADFDIIISNAALHWVKDHEKLLSNVNSALKDNGTVRFNFAANGNCSNFFLVIQEITNLPKYKSYFSSFVWPWYMPEIEDYKHLSEQFSFAEIKIWGENADRSFSDAEAMIRWIDQPSIVPFIKCVDEKDKKDFRDSVVNEMIKNTSQPDGTCFETFRRINFWAKK